MCVVDPGARPSQQHAVRYAQLPDELKDIDIAGEPVVVELLQSLAANIEAAGQATDLGIPFQHRDMRASAAELVGCGQAAEAGAQHDDASGNGSGHSPSLGGKPRRSFTT